MMSVLIFHNYAFYSKYYEIGAKLFEPESKMIELCGEMIVP